MNNIELLVPDLPESVADAVVATWHKKVGDRVSSDEILVDIETDKVVLEVPAPIEGVLQQVVQEAGATVLGRQILGYLVAITETMPATENLTVAPQTAFAERIPITATHQQPLTPVQTSMNAALSPGVRRLLAEHDLDHTSLCGSGPDGRLTRQDIEQHLVQQAAPQPAVTTQVEALLDLAPVAKSVNDNNVEGVKRVAMSRLRQRIAERLLMAKQNTAMLTTFNEVNMQPVMALRQTYAEAFEKKHGVRLGFMSFYIKAVVSALQRFPMLNACLEGTDILYHSSIDISIAVSTPRGLVTPVLRNCAVLSMAEIEQQIKGLALKGRDGKLTVAELTGGNFTITNGGVFGSLMSTPIINPPQSSILGMHAIKDRPVAVNGQVVILPMMYLALSYDHRLIDGQESVSFLVAVKENIEAPIRLLLDL